MDRLTKPSITIANRVAMVFTPFIHRIVIQGNIGVFWRIRTTATTMAFRTQILRSRKKLIQVHHRSNSTALKLKM